MHDPFVEKKEFVNLFLRTLNFHSFLCLTKFIMCSYVLACLVQSVKMFCATSFETEEF